MKHQNALAGLALVAAILTGCGSDTPEAPKATAAPSTATAAPAHESVSESDHQIFEKLYVEKCITSQQKDPDNLINNDQELGRICECMAKEISQRISKADAIHFNKKGEFPFDLVIMSNQAANHCMNQK